MTNGFKKFNFHINQGAPSGELEALGPSFLESMAAPSADPGGGPPRFEGDEAAARYYLNQVFSQVSGLEGLAAAAEPAAVPELRKVDVKEQPLTETKLVIFQQEKSKIPVFGSNVVVELDADRNIVSANAAVGEIEGVPAIATLSPAQALWRIGRFARRRKGLDTVDAPELNYFYAAEQGTWHLAYLFTRVPAAPPEMAEEEDDLLGFGHGGPSPRSFDVLYDYLVDAHDGSILLYFSAQPGLEVPVQCRGLDEEGVQHIFWGRRQGDKFELSDPLRAIKTFDLTLQDVDVDTIPEAPIAKESADWQDSNRAAVSAHINATRVYDFYKSELKRDGIDDKGMDLVSVVNCTFSQSQPPPQWSNAVWFKNRMWYGQVQRDGRLRSYARYLDVIAHELTHGVTETTANLVYRDQSGALNESFSDIFGVIIRNRVEAGADSDVGGWNWVIGQGLGHQGADLRDLQNPGRLTFSNLLLKPAQGGRSPFPAHMDDFVQTPKDHGGVHINSNIHNKAAYNLLTMGDDLGERVFTPRDVAILYYLALTRLGRLANFADTLQMMIDVASTFYGGDLQTMEQKVSAIKRAYGAVGIKL